MIIFDRLSPSLPSAHRLRFERETKALMHQRVFVVLIIGIVLIPLFSLLDLVAVSGHFWSFLSLRLGCSVFYAVMLLVHRTRFGKNYPLFFVIVIYILAGSLISMMVVAMGGYDSFYYPGLILVLITCSMIIPLSTGQSVAMALLMYLIYVVPILILVPTHGYDLKVFYTNNFFFFAFMLVTVIQCWNDTQLRARKFDLNLQLEYYAHNLEDEVEKRAKKLQESEIRYRELYDHIVDVVILVDHTGRIILANPRLYKWIGFEEHHPKEINLMEFTHPEDFDKVREQLLDRLPVEDQIQNFQFRLINTLGEVFDVECNAKRITKKEHHVGFQMVIRDVTVRTWLEKQSIQHYKDLQQARTSTILGLAKLAEYRDQETGAHLERIREYAKILALDLAKDPKYKGYITEEYVDAIYHSSILHDIGKVGIPDAILLKPGKLLPEEFEIIKQHTIFGGDALKSVEPTAEGDSFLTLGKEIAYYHHEKWDGSGYPYGLKKDQIPLATRIVSLADVYDALTSERHYKPAYTHEEASAILISDKGSHFAPDVVDAFVRTRHAFKKIREKINDNRDYTAPKAANQTI